MTSTRKNRIFYNDEKKQILLDSLLDNIYPTPAEYDRLADRIGATTAELRIWFQNKRQWAKKNKQRFQEMLRLHCHQSRTSMKAEKVTPAPSSHFLTPPPSPSSSLCWSSSSDTLFRAADAYPERIAELALALESGNIPTTIENPSEQWLGNVTELEILLEIVGDQPVRTSNKIQRLPYPSPSVEHFEYSSTIASFWQQGSIDDFELSLEYLRDEGFY